MIKNRLAIERNNYAKGGWYVSVDDDVKYVETLEEAVALATAARGVDLKACRDELCQYCGRYVNAHEGGCDGCRWEDL